MDTSTVIFLEEASASIQQLASKIEKNEAIGSFSASIYDTAWLAMVNKRDGVLTPLFPECVEYLLETQNEDGSWPEYASEVDGILNTMAAMAAFKKFQSILGLHYGSCPGEISLRIHKAEKALRAKLRSWDVVSSIHVGFEILIPTLLELLEQGEETIQFPGRQTLMALNQSKLAKFRPDILYTDRKTTLIHSLEAFVGKVDFDKVGHHIDEHGSMMASPSATAAYLMHCSQWDDRAEEYLRKVIRLGSGRGSGGVPSAFPSSIFEIAWTASTFLKAGLTPEMLGVDHMEKIGSFLQSQLSSGGGVVGFESGILADADDTAKVNITTGLLGLPSSPQKMVEEFESEAHFHTYKQERNESLSANCNVLDALLNSSCPLQYLGSVSKVTRFLCQSWHVGNARDKWNLSDQYSMMLLSQSFVMLLQIWDRGQLPGLPEELIYDQVPLTLFQIAIRTIENQASDGSWSLKGPSREVTAYAVLTLKALSSLPWLEHFTPQVSKALNDGCCFITSHYCDWKNPEHIWVEKVTYALPTISQSYQIAALCPRTSFNWSERVASLASVSSEKITKLSRFFSHLPMFAHDVAWLLEADVAASSFFVPRLMRVSSDIFPRQNKVHYKYLEYIPFTWIATNRKNRYPLPNVTLWDTMMIALLDYQLDEFMETILAKDEDMKQVEAFKCMVKQLCKFPNSEEQRLLDHLCGYNDSKIGVREMQESITSKLATANGSEKMSSNTYMEVSHDTMSKQDGIPEVHNMATEVRRSNESSDNSTRSDTLSRIETVLVRLTTYIFKHPNILKSPAHVRRQLHKELETCILAHIQHEEDNACFALQKGVKYPIDASKSVLLAEGSTTILPFSSPRGTYYSWVRNTSADNTHSPFTFVYFSCLATRPPGEAFFQGVRQHYLSNAVSRHLANLCREYNDYGSVARDRAEGNLNSLNFPEFHEPQPDGTIGDETVMKRDLLFVAEYERECLKHATARLNEEMKLHKEGLWRISALQTFIDTVDLYGQIYVARDITNRVK